MSKQVEVGAAVRQFIDVDNHEALICQFVGLAPCSEGLGELTWWTSKMQP